MVEAAAPFVRIMVRVPEAYLLIQPYETTRPALLVLDADGRRVDSKTLTGAEPADVAAWLLATRTKLAQERIVVSTKRGAELRDAFRDGAEAQVQGEEVVIRSHAGKLAPDAVLTLAARHELSVEIREPVAVRLKSTAPAEKLRGVPGIWYADGGNRIWVARLLLHPGALRAAGLAPDLEARRFLLPNTPKGALGARVALAPRQVEGVLSVFPDIFGDKATVVGRDVDWKAVLEAFEQVGIAATLDE